VWYFKKTGVYRVLYLVRVWGAGAQLVEGAGGGEQETGQVQ